MKLSTEEKQQRLYFRERPEGQTDKIVEGGSYKTKGGLPVKVYALMDNEIHGAVFQGKRWVIEVWDKNGKYFTTAGKKSDMDIVMNPPLKIIAGDSYKAADGSQCRIITINEGSDSHPIVGIIRNIKTGNWEPRIWNHKGHVKIPFSPTNDIVGEWSEG